MEFVYVFVLMFVSIFGLAMLLRLLAEALLDSCCRRFTVIVREDENIEEFIRCARKAPFIGTIEIIRRRDGDSIAPALAEKYDEIRIAEPQGADCHEEK